MQITYDDSFILLWCVVYLSAIKLSCSRFGCTILHATEPRVYRSCRMRIGMAWNDENEREGVSGWQLLCKEVRTLSVLRAECLTRRYGSVTSAQF